MGATSASGSGPAGDAVPREPRSRFRRLVHLYTSPNDRTPTWVGVAIGLLAVAGIVVLGPTDQLWLLACTGLLVYAVIGVARPMRAWQILRTPAGPLGAARRGGPPVGDAPPGGTEPRAGTEPGGTELPAGTEPAGDEDGDLDSAGWLPTRRAGRR